ncbi:MAG: hypothetical protein DMG96_01440 [Acidobacteria bacterium]|nr:MAG: hypothetical protein DMG96_01440 [Acidobacteriota bacterium]
MPRWTDAIAISIKPSELKSWLLKLDVSNCTRGKYRGRMSHIYEWAKSEELIPEFVHGPNGYVSSSPCTRVKGPGFSQETGYEALALEVEDTFKLLSEIKSKNGAYELALLVPFRLTSPWAQHRNRSMRVRKPVSFTNFTSPISARAQ